MNIIIVDDDKLVSLSLKTILEAESDINVLAVGDSGEMAIELYKEYEPDVLLMDIRMENMTGLEAAEEILKLYEKARILLLTTFSDDEYIVKAIHLGAKGYILKQEFDSIAPALRAVYNDSSVFGTQVIKRIPALLSNHENCTSCTDKSALYDISDRELRIIELIADGLNNKEIADELFLSEGTVRNYVSAILEKLELRDRTQLACFYYKNLSCVI